MSSLSLFGLKTVNFLKFHKKVTKRLFLFAVCVYILETAKSEIIRAKSRNLVKNLKAVSAVC
jgi:hypothetical protein